MFAPQDVLSGDQIKMEVLLKVVRDFLVEKTHLEDM